MANVYLIDANAVWTGEVIPFDPERGRPANSVTTAPPDFDPAASFAVWSGDAWIIRALSDLPSPVDPTPPAPVDPVPYYVPVPMLRQRLEKLGMFDDFAAYLALNPPLSFKVLTLEEGVDPAYPDLVVAFDAMSVPQSARDYLLAHPSVGVPDIPEDLTNG